MAKKQLTSKEKAKRKKEREMSDLRMVAKTPEGRRFLWKLLSRAEIFRPNDFTETVPLARDAERKKMGIELLNDIMTAKPTLFTQMQQEHASEYKREEIEEEEAKKNSDLLSLEENG